MSYTPSQHTALNKPIAISGNKPDSARMVLYSETTFNYRPFLSVDEANSYFPESIRNSWITVLINSTGILNTTTGLIEGGSDDEYWYKDHVNLIPKLPDLSDYAKTVDVDAKDANTLVLSKDYTDQQFTTVYNIVTHHIQSLTKEVILTNILEGGSYTIPDFTTTLVINPPLNTVLLNYTIILPNTVYPYNELIISFGQDAPDLQNIIVNKLVLDGNGKQTKFGIQPSIIRSGDTITLRLINGIWREL